MSDNAEILRELIHWCPDVVGTHPTRKEDAYRALDALVAERAEWERNCLGEVGLREIQGNRAEAAEAEVARLGLLLAETEGERVGWKERAEAAEAKNERLREALAFYADPVHSIDDGKRARAALAGEQP